MTTARMLIEQGRVEGRVEGIDEGIERGQRKVLLTQIGMKFGPVSDETRARVQAAGTELLELWASRILTATTLETLFDER